MADFPHGRYNNRKIIPFRSRDHFSIPAMMAAGMGKLPGKKRRRT
jgi:hypothetical protein